MRFVIIRDDDTNALTPVECLEQLYRPFLDKGLPINLATIPEVATGTTTLDGQPEGFLLANHEGQGRRIPLTENPSLLNYLHRNRGYHIVQHGLDHSWLEFNSISGREAAQRLERGNLLLQEAGFPAPETFVAPYDKISRAGYRQLARRFRVVSTGWFELGRLPFSWWLAYAWRKFARAPHWKTGQTLLLSHPGCLLSCHRDYSAMHSRIVQHISGNSLTVLVTHWWEYFREGRPDHAFINILHQTADFLASDPDIRVIPFSGLAEMGLPRTAQSVCPTGTRPSVAERTGPTPTPQRPPQPQTVAPLN